MQSPKMHSPKILNTQIIDERRLRKEIFRFQTIIKCSRLENNKKNMILGAIDAALVIMNNRMPDIRKAGLELVKK